MFYATILSLGLVFLAYLVFVVIMSIRRRTRARRDEPTVAPGFDLADLHRLRDAGQLSDEEHARAIESLLRRQAERDAERARQAPAHGPRGFDVLPPTQEPRADETESRS